MAGLLWLWAVMAGLFWLQAVMATGVNCYELYSIGYGLYVRAVFSFFSYNSIFSEVFFFLKFDVLSELSFSL